MFFKCLSLWVMLLACPWFSFSQTITRTATIEDVNQLQAAFEKYHAGLDRYTPKDSLQMYFNRVRSRLNDMDQADFFGEVTHLLNKVRCGHTRASMPSTTNNSFKRSQKFMPISVRLLDKKLVIDSVLFYSNRLRKGDEIKAINGKSVREVLNLIFDHHSSDGFINSNKYRLTEQYFNYYYQLYVEKGASRYNLEIIDAKGQTREVTIDGRNFDQLTGLRSPPLERAVLTLEHHEEYSYMKIGTFVGYYLRQADLNYESFLAMSFKELKERGVKNLILDLRGNGGGDDNYGAMLVSYFADKPFRYFDRIEVTDAYSGYGNIEKRNGKTLMTSHKGLTTWDPEEDRFTGNVFVLIDGWSFSTCADVATVLHYHNWAKFIGEETAGGYDGNTSGNSRTLTLANSGIRINLPMWKYTTANPGHKYYGRGVTPDYPIQQTKNDFLKSRDVVLDKALSLIRQY